MTVNFRFPEPTRVDVHYIDFRFGRQWFRELTLSLTANAQMPFVEFIVDLKRAADALGIEFANGSTLLVDLGDNPPLNWRSLANAAACSLGWEQPSGDLRQVQELPCFEGEN